MRVAALAAAASLTLTACSNTDDADSAESTGADTSAGTESQVDEDFDLDALVEAAKDEGPITIYDNASAIEDIANNFSEKYGIEATGIKVDAEEMAQMVTRESESGNIQGDVIAMPDVPALNNQLIAEGHVYSWIPGDMVDSIDEDARDPLVMIHDPLLWTYNDSVYDTCPIDNLWALTDEEWNNRVAMENPAGSAKLLDMFSQMQQFYEEDMAAMYEDHYGEPYEGESATEDWVAGIAANNPILTDSNEDVSGAVGAQGQTEPPMGLVASSKYRNIEDLGYGHQACETLEQWRGLAAPKSVVIASGTESENAAKLFVHFVMTEEGIAPQINDGKISPNTDITQPDDPSNMKEHMEYLFYLSNDGIDTDWADREKWSDHWAVSGR